MATHLQTHVWPIGQTLSILAQTTDSSLLVFLSIPPDRNGVILGLQDAFKAIFNVLVALVTFF